MSIEIRSLNSKSEYLNSKQILISQFSKFQTRLFGELGFRIWNLFRISDFGFRIFRLVLSFFILLFGFWVSLYAAPCYGTKMPGKKGIFMGAQTHSIFKRYLEDEFGKVRSTQHFLLLSYGVFGWLSLDLKGGAGNVKQHPAGSEEIDYSSSFAGGYGFRLRVFAQKDLKAVFGFQHISIHPKSSRLGDTRNRAILDDWQCSLLASYDYKKITPYLGTKWSRVDYIHKVEENRKRRMSDLTKDIGLVLGLDFSLNQNCWLNLESQFIDGEALAVSVNYSF